MARKKGTDEPNIAALREALSGEPEPSYEVETEEIDAPAGTDRPPAGFDPADYDDGEDDAEPVATGTTGEDPDPDDEGEHEVDGAGEDEEGDEDGDADEAAASKKQSESDADPDADGEDDGHDEDVDGEDEEDGTPERPYSLGADELEGFVRVEGVDAPVRIAELVKSHQERQKQQDIYLKRSREHAEAMRKVQEDSKRAEQVLAERTKAAEFYDVPDVFLQGAIEDWVQMGVMPQEMAEDIAQVFVDYHAAGKYRRDAGIQRIQQRQQQKQEAERVAAMLRDQAKHDLEYIETTTGSKLNEDQKLKIVDYIRQYAAENNGQHIRVRDAFLVLKAQGQIEPPPPAKPTPAKKLKRAKKRAAAFGKKKGKVGPGAPARSKPATPKNLTKLQEARSVRRALLGG